MTAESQPQPRHPLALLADLSATLKEISAMPVGNPARGLKMIRYHRLLNEVRELDESALHAQAEAEGKYRLMVAAWVAAEDYLTELDERGTHADWEAGNEQLSAAEAAMYTAFTPEQARAALAQAQAGAGSEGQGEGA